MVRIYLDSNIFRFLKKAETDFYRKLNEDLRKYSDRLIYFYSYAHLSDLKRDKSDKKIEDLSFMEKFVESNYLSLNWKEKFVNVQIATPSVAFEDIEDETSLSKYFNFEELFNDFGSSPEINDVKTKLNELMDMPMYVGLESNISNHSEEDKKAWANLIPEIKDEYTFREWIEQFSKMYENLFNDPKTYKELRHFSVKNLNLSQKYNIDIEKINFNEDLKNTPLQQSFLDFVNKSLEHSKNTIQREYEFFITAYNCLNMLGIDKESNKKAKLANTLSDAQHSYYAAHCDYLVSDDKGLILKSKVLYKLLGIDTKTLLIDEFSQQIGTIGGILDDTLENYFKLLQYDIKNGFVLNTKPSFRYNRMYTTIKPSQLHFSYFNLFDSIQDEEEGNIILFYRKAKNYSKFVSYKEFESVTNKIVKVLGIDNNFRGQYNDQDTTEIQNGNWKGRYWTIGELNYHLEINNGTREFNFAIILPSSGTVYK